MTGNIPDNHRAATVVGVSVPFDHHIYEHYVRCEVHHYIHTHTHQTHTMLKRAWTANDSLEAKSLQIIIVIMK